MATTPTRMTAEQRRESIVRAAGAVFGRTGYTGTTTDQVARAAGISQPYVVRMFGSKEALFVEVLDRAEQVLLSTFRAVLQDHAGTQDELQAALGDAYLRLIADDGIHLPLMHAFLAGDDPVVGTRARAGFLAVWRFLRDEAGLDEERASQFLATGMLLNVVVGLRLPADPAPEAAALVAAVCGPETAFVREHSA